MKTWQELGFQLIFSEDGSPTLRPYPDGQSMHHLGGALAESIFIYDKASEVFLNDLKGTKAGQLRFLIVGLGLAYIELLILKRAVLMKLETSKMYLRSHESQCCLTENISRFLTGSASDGEVMATYSQILHGICQTDLKGGMLPLDQQELLAQQIKELGAQLLKNQQWEIFGILDEQSAELKQTSPPFDVIYFDAYSEKASPELWSESLLKGLIQNLCAPTAVFATYACTGRLSRCLNQAGFVSVRSEGFKGKRNSTLMTRVPLT